MNEFEKTLYRFIGLRICHCREFNGLTQTELALKLRVTQAQLSRWEGGSRISFDRLCAIQRQIKLSDSVGKFVDSCIYDAELQIETLSLTEFKRRAESERQIELWGAA